MCKDPAMTVTRLVARGPQSPQLPAQPQPHRVVVLALPSVVAFELGLPHRFFAANSIDPAWTGAGPYTPSRAPAYEVLTVTVDDRPVVTSAGYQVTPTHPHTVLATADTIVIPGITDRYAAGDGALPPDLAALLATARPGVRWVSICTGAFVLAGAGLLDGLEATTHWAHAEHFRRVFPRVRLNEDVLYIDNGDILTSAGNAAGIDLLLHILRRDLGSDTANRVARGAVVAPWRAGGQAQFIERPVPETGDDGTGPARAWVLDHLDEPVTLASLAARAGMSVRTFTRRFRDETGETAGTWLLRVRVDHARHLLETTDLPVDRVAERSGFGTAASLRQHLTAAVGMPPLAYRRTYRAEGA
jgi:transcriptional regulator GlxA family with amidase domain